MNKYKLILAILFLNAGQLYAQDQPFIRLTDPLKTNNAVSTSRQFVIGSTCKTCVITINAQPVKVYPTGAFAFELNLLPGDSNINIIASSVSKKSATKKISFVYSPPKPADTVKTLAIESIQTFPEGNLVLRAGDRIQLKVKALTGCNVSTIGNTVLYEMPVTETGGMPGIYQGEYEVKPTDNFSAMKFPVTITDKDGAKVTRESSSTFAVMSPLSSDVARTKGRLAFLEYGLGEDRLGGAKIGYLDSLIPLKIIGKVGTDYKIELAPNRTAYIPDDLVALMPKGSFAGKSLTGRWRVYGDSLYDYVTVGLTARLAYQSMQMINPSTIIVDIFGATGNTNWITQLENSKEIENVDYEQLQNDVFRVTIHLRHQQHWGHEIYYNGSLLVIKIKRPPTVLSLRNLTIAVDAGHGGSNTGAGGPTGVAEKDLALAVSLKLQAALQKEGAKVIMTRTSEKFVDNKERILMYRDHRPDLLVSVHLNSSADPFRAGGTSTLYRYVGFRPLSEAINKRLLELGLKEYGNIGSFNFMLNSPTEYPNALVETLFLSNPEEEMLILDPSFQQKLADKIVAGIKDFLSSAK
jgi:N-acetylmuramoyl-L-alanine amidase